MSAFASFYILKNEDLPALLTLIEKEWSKQISKLGVNVSPNLAKLLLKANKGTVIVKDPDQIQELKKAFPKTVFPLVEGGIKLESVPVVDALESEIPAEALVQSNGSCEETPQRYILNHGKQPWQYEYSGYVFLDIFRYLEDAKGINIDKHFDIGDPHIDWFQMPLAMRELYLEQLSPNHFKEQDIQGWLLENSSTWDPLSDKGEVEVYVKAMIAGINIACKYLQCVDENKIVLWHIGVVDSAK